jgi:RES domain-containing protein
MARKQNAPEDVALRPHPETDRLARGIRRCLPLAVIWSGAIYRATSQEYANRQDVVTGEGSRRAGAQYTPRGVFRAVYGGLEMETALAEALANHRRRGLPDSEALPLTFVALRVTVECVLDLTRGDIRRGLGVSMRRLLGPWRADLKSGREALTQAVGCLAREAELQGLLYPSAARPQGEISSCSPICCPRAGCS